MATKKSITTLVIEESILYSPARSDLAVLEGGAGNFRGRVEALVAKIPEGKVMSYGQIAALCGSPRAARIVGGIAHYGDIHLPWHRVVNKQGGLASGYPGGRSSHAQHLQAEGIKVSEECKLQMDTYMWRPAPASLRLII